MLYIKVCFKYVQTGLAYPTKLHVVCICLCVCPCATHLHLDASKIFPILDYPQNLISFQGYYTRTVVLITKDTFTILTIEMPHNHTPPTYKTLQT